MTSLRNLWSAGDTTLGAWLTLPSSVAAEAVAGEGFDYVCIDALHGAVDYQTTVSLLQGIALGGSNPVVRVPWNEPGIIGRMLDAGAQGVIVPMVNTVADAEAVVRSCRYAPVGARSYGPTVVGLRHADYVSWATEHVAVIPMIETAEAVRNIDDILAVPGIDAVYVGPADLSLTLGLAPRNNDDSPEFTEALERVVSACRNRGVVPGAHCVGGVATRRAEQGFRMLTISSDIVAMHQGMVADLREARVGGRRVG